MIDVEEFDPRTYIECHKCNDMGCLPFPCKCNTKIILSKEIDAALEAINDRVQRNKNNGKSTSKNASGNKRPAKGN